MVAWKSADLRRLKELEDGNRRLKKIVADQVVNIEALKWWRRKTSKARTAQDTLRVFVYKAFRLAETLSLRSSLGRLESPGVCVGDSGFEIAFSFSKSLFVCSYLLV